MYIDAYQQALFLGFTMVLYWWCHSVLSITSLGFTSFPPNLIWLLYYDIEEKDKDKDEDKERETNFNKKASTYAHTQTSSPISRPEQQRSYSEYRPERSLPQDWEDDKSDSEDSCDVRIDRDILYIVVYYMFLTLQSYLWWFFTIFINKYE